VVADEWRDIFRSRSFSASSEIRLLDALVYALLTAGFFGWFWPA
jgi:hypothetical protein